MPEVSLHANMVTPAALHLTSLLDLSTRLSDSDSTERILNAALLSVMGKLMIGRACVLHPDGESWLITHSKGVPLISLRKWEITEKQSASPLDSSAPLYHVGIRLLIPIVYQGVTTAVLCFGAMYSGLEGAHDVQTYVDVVSAITATALHNAQTVQSLLQTTSRLEHRNLLVTTLLDSAREFSDISDVPKILRTLSYRLMGQLMISTFALYLQESVAGKRVIVNREGANHLHAAADAAATVVIRCRTSDLPTDDASRVQMEKVGLAAATPLTVHGAVKGVLAVCDKLNGDPFTDEELAFIESLGNAAMAAIEHDKYIEQVVEQRSFANELKIAAEIQQGLLPHDLSPWPLLDVAATTVASKNISGDYYEFITLDEHRALIAIADVAGKGIPAALLMANVQAALNVLASLDLPLTSIAERINSLICDNTKPEVFITMFLAVVDIQNKSLEYVNMGHNPPFMLTSTGVHMLTVGGVLAGVISNPPPYQLGRVPMPSDGILVLYTDGVSEARNADMREFGVDRLIQVVQTHAGQTSDHIMTEILSELQRFTVGRPLDDDTSMLIMRLRDYSV